MTLELSATKPPVPAGRRQCLLAALALGLAPFQARPQVLDLNDAINKAGRQRMLSQRMAKCYMALGLEVQTADAERLMSASMALFDRQLVELKAFSPTPEIRDTYQRLESTWGDYKTMLVGAKASKVGARSVLQQAGLVLPMANQGTLQLEAVSGKPMGRLVNISGRQRMLSQRMAAFYLSASWGVQTTAAAAEIDKARGEFVTALKLLKDAPEATPAIRRELEMADQQWAFFDGALRTLQQGTPSVRAVTDVFTSSERILQVMDAVTGLYAKV